MARNESAFLAMRSAYGQGTDRPGVLSPEQQRVYGRDGGGFGGGDILKQLQEAQDKANAANEARYKEILGLYEGLGTAGMTRIGQQEQQAQASSVQNLTSRGLGGTTIRGSMARGIAGEAELSRQQLQEGVSQQKAGVMERRTDAGPDLGLYANLLSQAAQGPRGGGGGGGRTISTPRNWQKWGMGTGPNTLR